MPKPISPADLRKLGVPLQLPLDAEARRLLCGLRNKGEQCRLAGF